MILALTEPLVAEYDILPVVKTGDKRQRPLSPGVPLTGISFGSQ